MSYEERGTWVYLFVTTGVYLAYVTAVLGRATDPITQTPYQGVLVRMILVSIVASVAIRVVVEVVSPSESHRADSRDRAIDHLGVVRTWWFLIAGALAGLVMAILEWPHFWIANVIYLGFVLQAIAGSIVKLVAYRRGF